MFAFFSLYFSVWMLVAVCVGVGVAVGVGLYGCGYVSVLLWFGVLVNVVVGCLLV